MKTEMMVQIRCKATDSILEQRKMPTNPLDWPSWEIEYLLQLREQHDGVFHVLEEE